MLLVNDMGSIAPHFGGSQINFDLNRFFLGTAPTNFFVTDPKIVYDASSGRWYMSIAAFDSNFDGYVFLAVSQSNDPSTNWWIYTILDQHTSKVFCDQPHLGFNSDKIVVTCDNFDSPTATVSNPGFMVLDKTGAITGAAYEYMRFFGNGDRHSVMQPVYSVTPTSTEYLVYYYGSGIQVMAVWGNPTNGTVASGESNPGGIAALGIPPPAVQKGSTLLLDTGGDVRLLGAVFQSNIIWISAGDSCTPTGDTAKHACMRLDRVDVTNLGGIVVTHDYDVGSVGTDLFYPAVTMDASGTVYVAYSASSANIYPEFDIAVITPATPDAIDSVFQVGAGAGPYSGPSSITGGPARWGDYSGASADPDGDGVWVYGEFANTGNQWGTEVGLTMDRTPTSITYTGPLGADSNATVHLSANLVQAAPVAPRRWPVPS